MGSISMYNQTKIKNKTYQTRNSIAVSLKDKVAVVSGGSTGIGFGIAEGLAQAGAKVVICARRKDLCEHSAKKVSIETGCVVIGIPCDVANRNDTNNLAVKIAENKDLGKVDILINSAGVGASEKSILKMEESDWDRTININLKGVFNLCQAIVPLIISNNQGGKVINVSSIMGQIAAPYMADYCVSKAALTHLTKIMALEWCSYGIQVNAISPGYFETSMNYNFLRTGAGQQLIKQRIPMKRVGNIEEIKDLALYLSSSASNFMTGSTLVIDGGQSVL